MAANAAQGASKPLPELALKGGSVKLDLWSAGDDRARPGERITPLGNVRVTGYGFRIRGEMFDLHTDGLTQLTASYVSASEVSVNNPGSQPPAGRLAFKFTPRPLVIDPKEGGYFGAYNQDWHLAESVKLHGFDLDFRSTRPQTSDSGGVVRVTGPVRSWSITFRLERKPRLLQYDPIKRFVLPELHKLSEKMIHGTALEAPEGFNPFHLALSNGGEPTQNVRLLVKQLLAKFKEFVGFSVFEVISRDSPQVTTELVLRSRIKKEKPGLGWGEIKAGSPVKIIARIRHPEGATDDLTHFKFKEIEVQFPKAPSRNVEAASALQSAKTEPGQGIHLHTNQGDHIELWRVFVGPELVARVMRVDMMEHKVVSKSLLDKARGLDGVQAGFWGFVALYGVGTGDIATAKYGGNKARQVAAGRPISRTLAGSEIGSVASRIIQQMFAEHAAELRSKLGWTDIDFALGLQSRKPPRGAASQPLQPASMRPWSAQEIVEAFTKAYRHRNFRLNRKCLMVFGGGNSRELAEGEFALAVNSAGHPLPAQRWNDSVGTVSYSKFGSRQGVDPIQRRTDANWQSVPFLVMGHAVRDAANKHLRIRARRVNAYTEESQETELTLRYDTEYASATLAEHVIATLLDPPGKR